MSTVTLRDATDDLERRLAGIGAAAPGRSGGWLYADEDEEEDLFGDDDLGFDDIDEDEIDEDDDDDVDEDDADEDEEP